jgi:hypothetical protein
VWHFSFSFFYLLFNLKIHGNSQCSRRTVLESGEQSYIPKEIVTRRTSRGSGRGQRIVRKAMRLTKSARDAGELAAINKNTPEVHEK